MVQLACSVAFLGISSMGVWARIKSVKKVVRARTHFNELFTQVQTSDTMVLSELEDLDTMMMRGKAISSSR